MIRLFVAIVISCFSLNFLEASQDFVKRIPEEISNTKAIPFWFLQDDSSQLIHIKIAFVNVGAAHLPKSQAGVAVLLSQLISSGSNNLTKLEFKQICVDNMIRISCHANLDNLIISCTCPIISLEIACKLLNEILRNTNYDEQEILKQQYAVDSRSMVLSNLLYSKLFSQHEYAKGPMGAINDFVKLSKNDLNNYKKKYIVCSNAKMCVCGSLSVKQAVSVVDKIFENVDVGEKSANSLTYAIPQLFSNIEYCYEEGPQSVISFVIPNEQCLSKKRAASVLLFTLLGSMQFMQNKIITELRNNTGLIYTGDLANVDLNNTNFIMGQLLTKNEHVDQVIMILKSLISKVKKDGISLDEFQTVRENVLGTIVVGLRTSEALCQFYFNSMLNGRQPDALRKLITAIKSVSLSELNNLARSLLDEEKLSIIVIGGNSK